MGLLDSAEEGMIDHKNNAVRLKIVVSDSGVGIDPSVSGTFRAVFCRPSFPDYRIHGDWFGTSSYPVS
jgi:hypothetical protein